MFGVVPKVLWERRNPPDQKNRIRLALRSLLITAGEERILVDTGIGRKYGPEFNSMFNVDDSENLLDSLRQSGFHPDDITVVVQTHLHFDHCGWATRLDEAGRLVPTFRNARYVVQAWEWEDATHPNRRTRGSYRQDDFLPLEAAGLVQLVDGDTELMPGVKLLRTGGHTRGHQIVIIKAIPDTSSQTAEVRNGHAVGRRTDTSLSCPDTQSSSPVAVFWGDLIPTISHIEIPYIMGYDTFPLVTMDVKEKLVAQAADEGWRCFFEHEPNAAEGCIRREGDKFRFVPLQVE